MFWMVGSELLPEAYRSISTGRIITVYLCTGVLFFGLLLLL
jgi:hypothetical protein